MIATIDPADARLSASIMINSSISDWFGGEHVGWTTKQLTPRTFSPTSTQISPSEKWVTSARPSGISTNLQTSSASARFELPVKIDSDFSTAVHRLGRRSTSPEAVASRVSEGHAPAKTAGSFESRRSGAVLSIGMEAQVAG